MNNTALDRAVYEERRAIINWIQRLARLSGKRCAWTKRDDYGSLANDIWLGQHLEPAEDEAGTRSECSFASFRDMIRSVERKLIAKAIKDAWTNEDGDKFIALVDKLANGDGP